MRYRGESARGEVFRAQRMIRSVLLIIGIHRVLQGSCVDRPWGRPRACAFCDTLSTDMKRYSRIVFRVIEMALESSRYIRLDMNEGLSFEWCLYLACSSGVICWRFSRWHVPFLFALATLSTDLNCDRSCENISHPFYFSSIRNWEYQGRVKMKFTCQTS